MKERLLTNSNKPDAFGGVDVEQLLVHVSEYQMPILERLKLLKEIVFPRLHRFGRVVYIRPQDDTDHVTVYFDSGRRIRTESDDEGILLEGIQVRVKHILRQKLQINDMIETGYFSDHVKKLASPNDMALSNIGWNCGDFEWKRVIGTIVWSR